MSYVKTDIMATPPSNTPTPITTFNVPCKADSACPVGMVCVNGYCRRPVVKVITPQAPPGAGSGGGMPVTAQPQRKNWWQIFVWPWKK